MGILIVHIKATVNLFDDPLTGSSGGVEGGSCCWFRASTSRWRCRTHGSPGRTRRHSLSEDTLPLQPLPPPRPRVRESVSRRRRPPVAPARLTLAGGGLKGRGAGRLVVPAGPGSLGPPGSLAPWYACEWRCRRTSARDGAHPYHQGIPTRRTVSH